MGSTFFGQVTITLERASQSRVVTECFEEVAQMAKFNNLNWVVDLFRLLLLFPKSSDVRRSCNSTRYLPYSIYPPDLLVSQKHA